jgi:3-deoxy-D-manno-octulosonic-acid transferase
VRPVWLAASTHQGEDEIVLAAHKRLRETAPDALLVIAPRHPERGEAIAALAGGAPRRSRAQPIGGASVYIADTLGELGLFYDLSPVALVAGSLLPHLKGHNPIEPAKLGAAIVTGPYVESFQDMFDALIAAEGAVRVADPEALAQAVARWWSNEASRQHSLDAARDLINRGGEAFEATVQSLLALTPNAAPVRTADASA